MRGGAFAHSMASWQKKWFCPEAVVKVLTTPLTSLVALSTFLLMSFGFKISDTRLW